MDFEEYKKEGIITNLSPTERNDYIAFHKEGYLDDLTVSDTLRMKSPRWSIIAGYYAMHDITKLYLAKHHGLKISERRVHGAVLVALRTVLKDTKTKEKAIKLLVDAQKLYEIFSQPAKEKILPIILSKGKDEREKTQYYINRYEKIAVKKSALFIEQIALPYIKIIEKMVEDDS